MVTFLYISSFNVPPQPSKNHELHSKIINFTQIIPFRQGYPDFASSNSVLKHFNYYSLHCRIITVMNSKWKARLEESWKSKLTHSSWQYCAPFLASSISLLIFHQTCGVFLSFNYLSFLPWSENDKNCSNCSVSPPFVCLCPSDCKHSGQCNPPCSVVG